MASVQELLAANEAKKSPFLKLLEGAATGFGQAQQGGLDRTIKLIQLDQMRQEMAQQQEMRTRIQQKFAADTESATQQGFRGVSGAPKSVLPKQKLKEKISQDEKGRYSISYEETDASAEAAASKPPPGYRWKADDSLEAIPGGPADIKNTKVSDKEAALLQGQIAQADLIIGKVDQALKNVSGWTAGFGAKLSGVPATGAKNLATDIETIKANLGFQQLQEMRRSSPTGGALGAVSERELTALQSAVSSLDQEQEPEQLKRNLNEIKNRYMKWKTLVANGGAGEEPQPATEQTTGMSESEEEELARLEKKYGGQK